MRPLSAALALVVPLLAADAAAQTIRWEPISKEDGIQVWQRRIPGQSLVEFRGKGIVDKNYKYILAVLSDSTRKTEWMEACVGAKTLQVVGPGHNFLYNRTGSKYPLIADRDVVLESSVDIWAERKKITVSAWSVEHASMPPVEDVVRMPDLRASWVLEALGPDRTTVTYTVRADPGGSIPHWLMNLVSKKMPYKTLKNLRKQVKKSGYDKQLAYVKASFDWSGFDAFETPQPQLGALEGEKAARSTRVTD